MELDHLLLFRILQLLIIFRQRILKTQRYEEI